MRTKQQLSAAPEHTKKMSRKAAANEYSAGSKATSRVASPNGSSRPSSRNPSRITSENEDTDLDSLLDFTDDEANNEFWEHEFSDVITNIVDRKRSSVQGREEAYTAFGRLSKFHYVHDELYGRVGELTAAFCKSIKQESSVRETTLALRALELLALSGNDNTVYENVEPVLTRAIRDSSSNLVKSSAIRCLGSCAVFAGAGEDGMLDQMNFFIDIVASYGESIGASHDTDCTEAALSEWGHLATHIWDLAAESEEAIEIFAEQLGGNDTGVQIAAGENIALLYEKSFSPRANFGEDSSEEDEDDEAEEDEKNDEDEAEEALLNYEGPRLVQRYEPYHDTPEVLNLLKSLATAHSKKISKKDKKSLHMNFISIYTSVEDARRGPMYNTAINYNTNRHFGSKTRVKIGRDGVVVIDRWWKWIRLNKLRRLLLGGFYVHFNEGNQTVLDSLPLAVIRLDSDTGTGQWKTDKGRKPRDTRRFAIHHDEDAE